MCFLKCHNLVIKRFEKIFKSTIRKMTMNHFGQNFHFSICCYCLEILDGIKQTDPKQGSKFS